MHRESADSRPADEANVTSTYQSAFLKCDAAIFSSVLAQSRMNGVYMVFICFIGAQYVTQWHIKQADERKHNVTVWTLVVFKYHNSSICEIQDGILFQLILLNA